MEALEAFLINFVANFSRRFCILSLELPQLVQPFCCSNVVHMRIRSLSSYEGPLLGSGLVIGQAVPPNLTHIIKEELLDTEDSIPSG